nr:hypothetical protein [uncultured Mediterranean phage uvMED]BAR25543.1 hypothetical protein [uncultured Mediterranean phage uvMED]
MDQNKKSPRKRARKPDGKFIGDNPLTTDVNEAWEPVEVSTALPKKTKYGVKAKISKSNKTAGKYSKQPKIKPTFGQVTTKKH